MVYISHRGNLTGKHHDLENSPVYVYQAIDRGFDVEVDLRHKDGQIFLGHEKPQYLIDDNFINENSIDSIDYLWVDAQGNDFKVIKSLGEKISIVKEGKCEGSYSVDLYVNTENNVNDIVEWLTGKGFKCKIVPDNVGKEADVHFRRS